MSKMTPKQRKNYDAMVARFADARADGTIDKRWQTMDEIIAKNAEKNKHEVWHEVWGHDAKKVWDALKAGTYVHPDDAPRHVSIGLLEWGVDLIEDKFRESKNMPHILVADVEAIGFSSTSNLIKSLKQMDRDSLGSQGLRMKVAYRALVYGTDYEAAPNRKGATKNGLDVYLTEHALVLIFVRRKLGLANMVRPLVDADRAKFAQSFNDNLALSLARIKEQCMPPILKKWKRHKEAHDRWMAKCPDPW